jgi:hypothetical protein
MKAPTDNITLVRSVIMKIPGGSFVYRHPAVMASLLFAAGTWNLFLGVLMCSYGYWLGALPLTGAVLVFSISYDLVQSIQSEPAVPSSISCDGLQVSRT